MDPKSCTTVPKPNENQVVEVKVEVESPKRTDVMGEKHAHIKQKLHALCQSKIKSINDVSRESNVNINLSADNPLCKSISEPNVFQAYSKLTGLSGHLSKQSANLTTPIDARALQKFIIPRYASSENVSQTVHNHPYMPLAKTFLQQILVNAQNGNIHNLENAKNAFAAAAKSAEIKPVTEPASIRANVQKTERGNLQREETIVLSDEDSNQEGHVKETNETNNGNRENR